MSTESKQWAGRDPEWIDPQKDLGYWALMQAPRYPKNPHIERELWSPRLDDVLREGVEQMDWWYMAPTMDRVMAMLDPEAIAVWR